MMIRWILTLFLSAFVCCAQTNISVIYSFVNGLGQAQTVKQVSFAPFYLNAISHSYVVGDEVKRVVTTPQYTNPMISGLTYLVKYFSTIQPPTVTLQFTNYFPTNISGTVFATDYTALSTNLGNGIYALTLAQAQAMFAPIGFTNALTNAAAFDTNGAASAVLTTVLNRETNGATPFNLQSATGLPESGVVNLTADLAGKAATNAPVTLPQLPSIPASLTTNLAITVGAQMASSNYATLTQVSATNTANLVLTTNLVQGATNGLETAAHAALTYYPTSNPSGFISSAPAYTFQNTNLNAGIVITNGWLVFVGTNLPASGGGVTTITNLNNATIDGAPAHNLMLPVLMQLNKAFSGHGNVYVFDVGDSTTLGISSDMNGTNAKLNSAAYQLAKFCPYVNSDGWSGQLALANNEVDPRFTIGSWQPCGVSYWGGVFGLGGYGDSGATNWNTAMTFQTTQLANYMNFNVIALNYTENLFVTTNGVLAQVFAVPHLGGGAHICTNYNVSFPLSTNMLIGFYKTNTSTAVNLQINSMAFGVLSNSINIVNCGISGGGSASIQANVFGIKGDGGLYWQVFPNTMLYMNQLGVSNVVVLFSYGVNEVNEANTNYPTWSTNLYIDSLQFSASNVPTIYQTWNCSSYIGTNNVPTPGKLQNFYNVYLASAASNNFPVLDIQQYFGGITNGYNNMKSGGISSSIHPYSWGYPMISRILAMWLELPASSAPANSFLSTLPGVSGTNYTIAPGSIATLVGLGVSVTTNVYSVGGKTQ